MWSRPTRLQLASETSWPSGPCGPGMPQTCCAWAPLRQGMTYLGRAHGGQNRPERLLVGSAARRRPFEPWELTFPLAVRAARGRGSLGCGRRAKIPPIRPSAPAAPSLVKESIKVALANSGSGVRRLIRRTQKRR